MTGGYVFISYDRADRRYVDGLVWRLRGYGISVWFDLEIPADATVRNQITDKIDGCAAFIVILTSSSLESNWVNGELQRAQGRQRPILPLLLEGDRSRWLELGLSQHTDVRDGSPPPAQFVDRVRQLVGDDSLSASDRWPAPPIRALESYGFGGVRYDYPRELILAYTRDWEAATVDVGIYAPNERLEKWLHDYVANGVLDTNALDCDTADERIVRLMAYLAPDVAPVYRGFTVDAAGLIALCVQSEKERSIEILLTDLIDRQPGLLGLFARHECTSGHDGCQASEPCRVMANVVDVLRDLNSADEAVRNHVNSTAGRPAVLRCLLDQAYELDLRAQLAIVPNRTRRCEWWSGLADGADRSSSTAIQTAMLVAAVDSVDRAVAEVVEADRKAAMGRAGSRQMLVLGGLTLCVVVLGCLPADLWLYDQVHGSETLLRVTASDSEFVRGLKFYGWWFGELLYYLSFLACR